MMLDLDTNIQNINSRTSLDIQTFFEEVSEPANISWEGL